MIHFLYMNRFINFSGVVAPKLAKFSIFLIYFWFGALKVFGESPASPLVLSLLGVTMPSIEPSMFLVYFGLFEMLIGLLFLVPKFEKAAILLLALHLGMTVLPLFLLPHLVWTKPFVPTMEGQYIIKNILILALAFGIISHWRTRK